MYGYDIFHDKLAEGLISNVRRGNPPHAYIFEGEKGLGRYETARLFAAALACGGENMPCGRCNACVSAKSNTNPDIVTVEPEEKRKTIGTERMRALITDAYTKPFLSKRKVYIFRDAQQITEQAQNAFLKLLEEPPEYAVFIIIAQNADLLLQTVRSRCVLVRFPVLPEAKLREYVEGLGAGAVNVDFLVKFSRGIPGQARQLLNDAGFEELRRAALDKLPLMLFGNAIDAYGLCEFVEEHKDNAAQILSLWREMVRDMIVLQAGGRELVTNSDFADRLSELAVRLDEKKALIAAEEIIKTEEMLRRYVSLRAAVLRLGLKLSLI